MNSNNVIAFPKSFQKVVDTPTTTMDEIDHNLEMMRHYHIQETIATITPMIFNHLDIAGFGFPDDESIDDLKTGAFVVESIRALLCKHYGMYHPFQIISDEVFAVDPNDEGALKIAESLVVELKKN